MTVGAPLVGALRRRIVSPAGRLCHQPDRKGPSHNQRWVAPFGGRATTRVIPYEADDAVGTLTTPSYGCRKPCTLVGILQTELGLTM